MSIEDLVTDLEASLHEAKSVFESPDDAHMKRMLNVAALDMGRVRPRTMLGSITLVAEQDAYTAPVDLLLFKSALWGNGRAAQPWDKSWTGRLPDVRLAMNGAVREMHLQPAPTAHQIAVLGATYKFYYFAGHVIGTSASDTSVLPGDRSLLLLRAQAEALKEMAMRNINKPTSMRDGISNMTRNGTPAYLWEQMMKVFEERVQ